MKRRQKTVAERVPDASERLFQDQVVQIFRMNGWLVFHASPHMVRAGVWRSDGRGFPDLCCAHPTRGVLFAELKTDTGRLSEAQMAWQNSLAPSVEFHLWRPRHLSTIADRAAGKITYRRIGETAP